MGNCCGAGMNPKDIIDPDKPKDGADRNQGTGAPNDGDNSTRGSVGKDGKQNKTSGRTGNVWTTELKDVYDKYGVEK